MMVVVGVTWVVRWANKLVWAYIKSRHTRAIELAPYAPPWDHAIDVQHTLRRANLLIWRGCDLMSWLNLNDLFDHILHRNLNPDEY